jgi:hypothetical protein
MESERGLPRAQERSAIQELARRLAALDPQTDAPTDLVGLMAGALYSLDRAAELGFDDARVTPNRAEFAAELRATQGRAVGGRGVSSRFGRGDTSDSVAGPARTERLRANASEPE